MVNPWKFTCSDTPNYHMCWWCSNHFTIKLWFNIMMFNRWKPYVWFPSAVPFINCACNVGTQGITAEPIPWDFKHQFFSTHWKLPSSRVKIQISPESYPCCSSWRAESKEYPIMLSCLAKSGLGYWYRMLDFTFPLQLKGTCLPQKNCFSLDLVYYNGWDCIGIYIYMMKLKATLLAHCLLASSKLKATLLAQCHVAGSVPRSWLNAT